MKKLLCTLTVLTLVLTTTVFAHGGHGRGHHQPTTRQTQYALCTVEGCAAAQNHRHSGAWYRGHTATSGNYAPCGIETCLAEAVHEHSGYWYCGQTADSGDYAICSIVGCAAVTLHEHEGVWYHCPIANTTAVGPGRGCCRS